MRGLAVLCVVLAHSIATVHMHSKGGAGSIPFEGGFIDLDAVYDPAYNLIASVYMPLFAFVSGLVQGIKGTAVTFPTVRRRFHALMIPYLAWTVIGVTLAMAAATARPVNPLSMVLAALLDPRMGAAWFLYALFMVYVLLAAVTSVSSRPSALVGTAIAMTFVLALPIPNVMGVRDVALLYPFFVVGMLETQTLFLRRRALIIAAAVMYPLLLATIWPATVDVVRWWTPAYTNTMRSMHISNTVATVWVPNMAIHFGKYACALAGVVLIYNLYARVRVPLLEPQAYVGRQSLGVYVSHRYFLLAAFAIGVAKPVALFAIGVAGSLGLTLILERVPVASRLLLGRPPIR